MGVCPTPFIVLHMKKKGKVLNEATNEDQRMLKSVTKNYADVVEVRGRKFKVKWMHPATADMITCLMLKKGNDSKILSQGAALIVLNGFWKSHLFYWLLWRWFYYIKQYNSEELTPLFEMAQKKTQQHQVTAYLNATILLTALNDAKKTMTKEEAERTLRALSTANAGKSPRSTESTPGRSSSSESPSAG